ncbi:MAG TPA: hypothetical protein VNW06_09290, partial [Cytophagaceae bacterium]|nr:hypothetical protein [Cytophagaceae bacterium]
MTFKKLGEYIELGPNAIQDVSTVIPIISENVLDEMKKFASNLKRIAPKAEDFLYFSAVMMHAAEAALVNEDGTPKLTRSGEKIQGGWDESGGTWRWKCNDSNIKPYKNSNGDIFPEKELVKAFKKWVGRPLCIDHKSNSVDHIRGIIVDTYYDRELKRVIALCALDKQNYPDLAKKVSSGVSNSVSMGTAVGRAICFDCGQVARTEHDFCQHMRAKSCYGEINVDLSPIELSIVVNGADPQAKIKHIIAAANHLNNYVENKEKELEKLTKSATAESMSQIKMDLDEALDKLAKLEDSLKESKKDTNDSAFNQSHSSVAMPETEMEATDFSLAPPVQRYAEDVEPEKILALLKSSIESKLNEMKRDLDKLANRFTSKNNEEEIMSGSKDNMNKQGYYQGAGGINEPTPGEKKYPVDPTNEKLRESGDKQMVGQGPFPDVGPIDGMHPSPDSADKDNELERKKM